MANQVQAKRGIVEKGQVGPSVRKAHQAIGVVEHAAHRVFIRIEQRRREYRVQLLGNGEVKHEVQRVLAGFPRQIGNGALFENRMGTVGHFDDLDLIPFAIEQAEIGGGRNLGAHGVAKRLGANGLHEGLALQSQCGLPGLQALDRVGRVQGEIHRERAA